jgi:hypothetical protein
MWQLRVKEKAPVSPKRRKLPSAVPLLLISISSLHISPKGECTSLITARNPVPPTTRRFSANCSRASKSSVRIPSHSTRRLSEMLAATFSLSLHLNSYDCGNHTQFPPPCQGKRRTFLDKGDPLRIISVPVLQNGAAQTKTATGRSPLLFTICRSSYPPPARALSFCIT